MNAPWKAGLPSNRDPFMAFVCDEATLDQLHPAVVELGWSLEKCQLGGLRNAVQTLSVTASPAILLVDLSESHDPLEDINALAEVCEPGTVVIAIGQVNDVRLYRGLIDSGIHDYLLKPLSAGQLHEALTHAQMTFITPKPHEAADGVKQHVSTAVVGTRGGVGASTVATSLAWLFSTDHALATALLDLDIHFGTGALTLDLEPGRGLTDAIDNPARIDGLFLERAMVRANDNLAILSAEASISTPLMTDGTAFMRLEEEFRQSFDMTMIDLPRNMLINFPLLLNTVNAVVVVTELTLAAARDTIRLLAWLKANAAQAQIVIVANRVQPGLQEISKADFEASIEARIDHVIPADPKAAIQAAQLGQALVNANPASKATAALRGLAQEIRAIAGGEPAGAGEAKPSLLGKLDLKALIGRKQKMPA